MGVWRNVRVQVTGSTAAPTLAAALNAAGLGDVGVRTVMNGAGMQGEGEAANVTHPEDLASRLIASVHAQPDLRDTEVTVSIYGAPRALVKRAKQGAAGVEREA